MALFSSLENHKPLQDRYPQFLQKLQASFPSTISIYNLLQKRDNINPLISKPSSLPFEKQRQLHLILIIYQVLMSELQQAREPQRLFKYAIDRHIKLDQKEKIHFYRANRWRYNTFNRFNFLKTLKLKGPITFGIFAGIVVDYTYGFYSNPAAH